MDRKHLVQTQEVFFGHSFFISLRRTSELVASRTKGRTSGYLVS